MTGHRGQDEALATYKLLFDHARDPILLMDRGGRLVEANEAAIATYGYSREELLSLNVLNLRCRESQELAREQMSMADDGGVLFEAVHCRKDGSEFDVEVSSRGVDIAGKRYLLSTIRDITGRKAAEMALRLANQQLRIFAEIIAHSPDPILVFDRDYTVTVANPAYLRYRGKPAEEVVGRSAGEVIGHQAFRQRVRPTLDRAFEGELVEFEDWLEYPGMGRRYLSIRQFPLLRDERIDYVAALLRDETERQDLEQSREEFLSLISHDLRAPVTVVQGNAQILQRVADQPDKVLRTAESIYTAARRMNRMIQDLVDSARLESGQLRLERIPIDLTSFTIDLKTRLLPLMDTGRISIDVQDVAPPALADPDRLERILTNLLSNALKYTEGEVEVSVSAVGAEVEVSVVDHGPGLSPEEVEQLFTRHYRARSAQKREGLGLGLYITRMLVEAHGGRIWAECKVGQGCTFRFTLPAD